MKFVRFILSLPTAINVYIAYERAKRAYWRLEALMALYDPRLFTRFIDPKDGWYPVIRAEE